jgi:Flp pilus assembly protein TadG
MMTATTAAGATVPPDAPRPRGRCRRVRRAVLRDERGAVSAELVIATPLLLLLIMGVIQFALWEHAEHIATAVAQQGVAVGRLQNESAAAGQQQAQSVLDQLGPSVLTGTTITATRTEQMTTVTVTGHAESIVGLFSLPVKATAAGGTENYTYPAQAP